MSEGRAARDAHASDSAGHAPDVPAGYWRTEVGVIPEDWESSSVCAIASSTPNAIVGGPFGSDLVSKDYVAQGVPVIRGQNMGGRWVSGDFVFVTPMKARALEANLAYPGDIVFTQRGTLGQVSLVPDKPFSAYVVSQSQMKLSVNRRVADPLFVFYFFTSYEQKRSIQGRAIQTGVPHINLGILRAMPVRLPSLAQQRAIAAVLSDVDDLIASLEALIAKKRAIKQAAMQQLLTGRARLPGFGGEWETKRLSEVAVVTMGQSPPSTSYNVFGDGLPLIQGKADIVGRNTTKRIWTTCPSKRCAAGDIVLTVRAPVGSVARASLDACLGRGVCGLKPLAGGQFLYYALVLAEGRWEDVEQGSTFSAANSDQVAGFPIAVPAETPEQQAIATVLSDMDAEIAALERRLDKTRAIKQSMMQQLLTGSIRLPIPDDDTEDDDAYDA